MKKIGHHPGLSETIDGWSFRRCRCGLVLALSASKRTWWVRANSPAVEIVSLDALLAALTTDCRYYRGRAPAPAVMRDEPRPVCAKGLAPARRAASASPIVCAATASKPVVIVKPRRRVVRSPSA
jgi:hypothetical protein